MLLAVGACALVFYKKKHHDWKKYNQSQLGKEKKHPASIYLVAKVLDKHLSAVSHIKRMDESSSKRAKQQTSKTSFKCKTPAHKEKVNVCHEWIRAFAAANIPLNTLENFGLLAPNSPKSSA